MCNRRVRGGVGQAWPGPGSRAQPVLWHQASQHDQAGRLRPTCGHGQRHVRSVVNDGDICGVDPSSASSDRVSCRHHDVLMTAVEPWCDPRLNGPADLGRDAPEDNGPLLAVDVVPTRPRGARRERGRKGKSVLGVDDGVKGAPAASTARRRRRVAAYTPRRPPWENPVAGPAPPAAEPGCRAQNIETAVPAGRRGQRTRSCGTRLRLPRVCRVTPVQEGNAHDRFFRQDRTDATAGSGPSCAAFPSGADLAPDRVDCSRSS